MTDKELIELEELGRQAAIEEEAERIEYENKLREPHKTEVRHIKDDVEKALFFESKGEAFDFMFKHKSNEFTEERIMKEECVKDDSGIYFIIMGKNVPATRG